MAVNQAMSWFTERPRRLKPTFRQHSADLPRNRKADPEDAVSHRSTASSWIRISWCSCLRCSRRTWWQGVQTLEDHLKDMEPDNNHVYRLIKAVTHAYIKIRMHHLAKQHNAQITGKVVRKQVIKLILFKHQ